MKRLVLSLVAIASMLAIAAPDASAQSRSMFGPKGGIWLDAGRLGLGVIGDFAITNEWSFEPGLQFVLGLANTTLIIIDGNVRYNFHLRGETFSPYINGGLGIWFASYSFGGSNTDPHLNLGGGMTFSTRSTLQPFVGMNITFINGSDIMLYGGVKFAL